MRLQRRPPNLTIVAYAICAALGGAFPAFGVSLYAAHWPKGDEQVAAPHRALDRTPELAVRKAFDRVTGEPIAAEELQTYAEALAGYHLSPESKFRGGERFAPSHCFQG